MHYYEVAPAQIIRLDSQFFTYSSTTALGVGSIVTIEVGKKQLVGVVIRKVPKPPYETKSVLQSIEQKTLPEPLLRTSLWISQYYSSHLGTVLQAILPRGIQKTRRHKVITTKSPVRDRTKFILNGAQQAAVHDIATSSPGSILLHGVTGSGKTIVYIEVAKQILHEGRSVIILVPEISLTSQLVDEFSHHFQDIILVHSKQTEAERHISWKRALETGTPVIAIGPRSALFTPLNNVGLIVVDEAHEPSYKQEQSPRYSALRVASVLAKHHNAKVIFGSATPLVTEYYLAKHSDRPIIHLPHPAREITPPEISLIDMTSRQNFKHHRFLSDSLLHRLSETFDHGHQALIFHNRRGSAPLTLCENCGWQAACPRCFISLTLHNDTHSLQCHICGYRERVPTSCPVCSHADIIHKGIGTKLIEAELRKLFPNKNIVRFDGDNNTNETLDVLYESLYTGAIDLIVGTQIVAKGLDLPNLRTVGVIQADAGLGLPDYITPERTFQLLAQVVGRVGRSKHATHLVIQSYQPSHPSVVDGIKQNYSDFYVRTLEERKRAQFPPFVFLLKLTCTYKTEAAAVKNTQMFATLLREKLGPSIQILGPTPSFYERQRDNYRWQIVLKSPRRQDLVNALAHLPATHWQAELDPLSLL